MEIVQKMLPNSLLLSLIIFAGACGDRIVNLNPKADSGIESPSVDIGGASPPDKMDFQTAASDSLVRFPSCVIAVRVDDCCTTANVHTQAEVDSDPCLEAWPHSAIPGACRAKWTDECDLADCTFVEPPSRSVKLEGDFCRFVDECETAADCVVAVDRRLCCGCAQAYPRASLGEDSCLAQEGAPWSGTPEECIIGECSLELCNECQPPPAVECVQMLGDSASPKGLRIDTVDQPTGC